MMEMNRSILKNKIIDCHNHIGVCIKAYARLEYPYAETLESLFYKQMSAGVDVSIVFPDTSDLFFNLKTLISKGLNVADKKPISELPYAIENTLVMREIFEFNPEIKSRFIPFVSVDPERKTRCQVKFLESLEKKYPIYGIKINPTTSQSKIICLSKQGNVFLRYARERNIPFLFHTSPVPEDYYSHVKDAFKVIEKNPDIRFGLAHAIVFHKRYLDFANSLPNVWVDTAALKIQVDSFMAGKLFNLYEPIAADFSDHKKVMKQLMEMYPDTMMWGSDSPAYSYICRRRQGKNIFRDFNYKGSYKDEKDALDYLPAVLKKKISNTNTLNWLFGA